MNSAGPTTLLIGEIDRPEFRAAARYLRRRTTLCSVRTLAGAIDQLRTRRLEPDLIVVAEARPGQFVEAQIAGLRRLAPLARVVQLLGNWCEGEERTGTPWPAEVRLFWHELPARLGANLDRLARGECPDWGLPVAASEADRLTSRLARSALPGVDSHSAVVVSTLRAETAETLAELFASLGWATVWTRPGETIPVRGAVAACWEGVQMDARERRELRQLAGQLPGIPIAALLDFPRPETARRARAAGATAILGKPYLVDSLVAALCPAGRVELSARY